MLRWRSEADDITHPGSFASGGLVRHPRAVLLADRLPQTRALASAEQYKGQRRACPALDPPAGRDVVADGRESAAGAVAYYQLPVSALPQVDYPTIQVLTFYPGASPEVVASSITAPLERQFGQVPGLKQMTSSSSAGSSVITLQFALELNIDMAQQDVQAAINAAATFLPRDLPTRRSTVRSIPPMRLFSPSP